MSVQRTTYMQVKRVIFNSRRFACSDFFSANVYVSQIKLSLSVFEHIRMQSPIDHYVALNTVKRWLYLL